MERDVAELFSGRSEHTLDAEGWVIVPAKYRTYFADGGRLGVGDQPVLALWTHSSYEDAGATPGRRRWRRASRAS